MVSPARLAGVGIFVIGGLVMFAVALFMIGNRQMAFSRRFVIYTEFATVTGLQTGAIVRVSGARAGEVTEIRPPSMPAGRFRVAVEVTEDLHQLVRTDSVASIRTEGLVGGSYLSISTGTANAPEASPQSTIPSQEPFELADLFQQMNATVLNVNTTIDEMRGELEQTIVSIGDTVQSANDVITSVSGDVKKMAASGAQVSNDLATLTTSVREGRGTVGKLFADDELYTRVTQVASNAEAITAETRAVVSQARETLEDFRGAQGPVVGVAGSLKQTLDDTRLAMSGFAESMDALRHNFLLRGFFNARGYYDLDQLSPAEYRRGALLVNGRGVIRVWLAADRVFEPTLGESQVLRLSADGERRLDSAIAPYLDRIADGVLMIEGFAQEGGRDQQFVTSRARAVAVHDYLVERFHLDTRSTGVMPLGADSTGGAPSEPWDGVALAFFLKSR